MQGGWEVIPSRFNGREWRRENSLKESRVLLAREAATGRDGHGGTCPLSPLLLAAVLYRLELRLAEMLGEAQLRDRQAEVNVLKVTAEETHFGVICRHFVK